METIIVIAVVIAAGLFIARTFYRQFKGKGSCSSGCSCSHAPEIKNHCSGDLSQLNNH